MCAFGAGSAVETMAAILLSEPPDLTSLRQGIPHQLERIVRRCLEKQRGARFQSARDLAFALESLDTAPKGLWPLDDSSLWTQVGDTMLHRDPAGSWRTIELPDGASAPSIAVSGDGNEVWLAAQVGGTAVVFATPARAQQPAPAPTPAAP